MARQCSYELSWVLAGAARASRIRSRSTQLFRTGADEVVEDKKASTQRLLPSKWSTALVTAVRWTAVDLAAFLAGAALFYPRELDSAGLMMFDPRTYSGILPETIITGVVYFMMMGPMAVVIPLNVGLHSASFLPTPLKRLALCSIAVGCFASGLHYSNIATRF
jgi:hypothetical protein